MPEFVIGTVDELPPGTKRIVKLNDVEIGVFNVRGQLYAMPNHCLHQGGPLCEGNVGGTYVATEESGWKPAYVYDGEIVVCPWHAMEFNVTSGRCLGRRRARLRQYRVRVDGNDVKITL